MKNEKEVLERVLSLTKQKGWSLYKLALEAGITQSTITNMFSRKTYPSIKTLMQICDALGISLSEFFNLNDEELNEELLSKYNLLSSSQQKSVLDYIQFLINKKD